MVGAEVEAGRLAGPGRRAFSYDLVCAPKRKLQRDTCSTSVLLIRPPGPAAHVAYPLFLSQRGKDPHGIGHQPASPADRDAGLRVTWRGLFSELCALPNHRKLYYPLCISRPCKKTRFCKTRFCFLGKAKFRKSKFLTGQQIGWELSTFLDGPGSRYCVCVSLSSGHFSALKTQGPWLYCGEPTTWRTLSSILGSDCPYDPVCPSGILGF